MGCDFSIQRSRYDEFEAGRWVQGGHKEVYHE